MAIEKEPRSTRSRVGTALATEDLLTGWLEAHMLGVRRESLHHLSRSRSKKARAIDDILSGGGSLGFDTKLSLLKGFGLIRQPRYEKLAELNRIRNKCSHNWELNALIRRRTKRTAPKRWLVEFRGKNLLDPEVTRQFAREYGRLYFSLFLTVYA